MAAVKTETQLTVPPAACAATLALFMRFKVGNKYPSVDMSEFSSAAQFKKYLLLDRRSVIHTCPCSFRRNSVAQAALGIVIIIVAIHLFVLLEDKFVLPESTPIFSLDVQHQSIIE